MNRSSMMLIVATLLCALSGLFSVQAQTVPSFGRAATYGVVAAAGISSTGATVIHGDAGSYPTGTITGFPPGSVAQGTLHVAADVPTQGAIADAGTAYNAFVAMPCNTSEAALDIGGTTITAGVHCYSTTLDITGIATLDAQGISSAVFIFRSGTIFTAHSSSSIVLINGANPCNVYWVVGSSAVIQTIQVIKGNILAAESISFDTSASTTGRVYAGCVSGSGAVSCDTNDLASGVQACAAPGSGSSSSSTGVVQSSTAAVISSSSKSSTASTPPGTLSSSSSSTAAKSSSSSSSSTAPGNGASAVQPQALVWMSVIVVLVGSVLLN